MPRRRSKRPCPETNLNLVGLCADRTPVDDRSKPLRAIPELASRAVLPLLIVLLGISLTTLMAVVQQDAAEREQRLMFQQAVERQHLTLANAVTSQLDDLDSAVDFVTAVFPSDVAEYRRFFGSSQLVGQLSNLDPGVFVVEPVARTEVEALEARERSLGNDAFVVTVVEDPVDDDYLVVTRTARDVSLGGISFEGLEVSALIDDILDADLPPSGQLIQAIDTRSPLARFLVGTQSGTEAAGAPVIVAVTQSIADQTTGQPVAWAIRIFDPTTLVTGLETGVDRRLNVEVSMSVLGEPVTLGETDEPLLFADAALAQEVATSTAGLDWTTRIWADSDFSVSTGLADQGTTWTFGVLVTSAVVLGAVWRAVQEFRLSRANFELEHARTLASTDSLTGLLNRQGFIDGVRGLDPGVNGTLFFIDLDGFKRVNDSRGHEAGDVVLREVAELLTSQFRNLDLVGRFGGDEFAVFTPELIGEDHRQLLSGRVISSLVVLEDDVSCSVGTATKFGYDHVDVLELIRRADVAMYRAKQQGGGRFESSPHTR